MTEKSFDLEKIRVFLKDFPDVNVFVLSGNIRAAKHYAEGIKAHTKDDRRFQLISSDRYALDGLDFRDSIVILGGYWWQNKNASTFIDVHSKTGLNPLPITHLPKNKLKGGDDNQN